jgi:hypothetical protein
MTRARRATRDELFLLHKQGSGSYSRLPAQPATGSAWGRVRRNWEVFAIAGPAGDRYGIKIYAVFLRLNIVIRMILWYIIDIRKNLWHLENRS